MSAKTSTWCRKPNAMASEHRAVQVGAGVAEVHSGEHAAQIRVVERALLAEEVGQAQHLGRRGVRRLVVERRSRSSAAPIIAWNQRMRLPLVAMQPFGSQCPGTGWASR